MYRNLEFDPPGEIDLRVINISNNIYWRGFSLNCSDENNPIYNGLNKIEIHMLFFSSAEEGNTGLAS